MYNQPVKNWVPIFAVSPSASVPDSFLIEILDRLPGSAVDTSPRGQVICLLDYSIPWGLDSQIIDGKRWFSQIRPLN